LKVLDANDMESNLCREIQDYKEEITRQMDLTEKLTNQLKGNKRTYFDAENGMQLLLFVDIHVH
jgi:nucleosome-remodeling factor subunit BPTF